MGATTFHNTSKEPDVKTAFRQLREQAQWENGHGGYTGTIAEKSGYAVFKLPIGKTVSEVEEACHDAADTLGETGIVHGTRPDWLSRALFETYNDKWGPAVAIHDGKVWHFMGWASE